MPPHLIIHIIITTRSKGCMLACLACASPRLNDVFSFGLPRYLFHSCTALHVRHLLLFLLAATELCCALQCHCNNGAPLWGGSGSKRRTRRPFSCCCCSQWMGQLMHPISIACSWFCFVEQHHWKRIQLKPPPQSCTRRTISLCPPGSPSLHIITGTSCIPVMHSLGFQNQLLRCLPNLQRWWWLYVSCTRQINFVAV